MSTTGGILKMFRGIWRYMFNGAGIAEMSHLFWRVNSKRQLLERKVGDSFKSLVQTSNPVRRQHMRDQAPIQEW